MVLVLSNVSVLFCLSCDTSDVTVFTMAALIEMDISRYISFLIPNLSLFSL